VRLGAADEGDVEQARQVDVVDIRSGAGEEARVLAAEHSRTNRPRDVGRQ
jgi:hypothetical protein